MRPPAPLVPADGGGVAMWHACQGSAWACPAAAGAWIWAWLALAVPMCHGPRRELGQDSRPHKRHKRQWLQRLGGGHRGTATAFGTTPSRQPWV